MSALPTDSPLIRALVERLLPAVAEARSLGRLPAGLQLLLSQSADYVQALIDAERVQQLAATRPRRAPLIDENTYFHDYPSEPVGGDNPYNCCAYCKRTDPEINGKLAGHLPNCIYRQRKEKDLRGELWMPMAEAMTKAGEMRMTVRFNQDELSTADGWFVPLKDDGRIEAAFVELVTIVEERL